MKTAEFDRWRDTYAVSSIQDHAALYDQAFLKDPKKASFSGRAVRVFLNQMGSACGVAEIGGRDGALAKVALEFTPEIKRWINYEISPAAITATATKDPRYEARLMTDFRWWKTVPLEGDILVMSHVAEHLADEDFKSLVAAIPSSIRGVHVQAPISMRGPTNWKGFSGAHILSMGWVEVDREFTEHGFRSMTAYDGASWRRA